jgi:hypothetical protein
VRPNAAAAAFWRFACSYIFMLDLVNLGTAGSADETAASPATAAPRVFKMEGMLLVCLSIKLQVSLFLVRFPGCPRQSECRILSG